MKKIVRCADKETWTKALAAFGQGKKPVEKVVGCKTDPIKPPKPEKKKPPTMRDATKAWRKALILAEKIVPQPTPAKRDWWALTVPDYENSRTRVFSEKVLPEQRLPTVLIRKRIGAIQIDV